MVPLRLDAVFQDSGIALSLVQGQNIHKTTVCFDDPCMDGWFTNTGALGRERIAKRRRAFTRWLTLFPNLCNAFIIKYSTTHYDNNSKSPKHFVSQPVQQTVNSYQQSGAESFISSVNTDPTVHTLIQYLSPDGLCLLFNQNPASTPL